MPKVDDTLDRSLLYVLNQHIGKSNAIERWDLVETITGKRVPEPMRNDSNVDDREIRYAVNRLRKEGYLICDMGNGNGRYLAANENEFWEHYGSYVKPLRERAEVARAMKKAALKKWPNAAQIGMFSMDDFETMLER
jgi:hypothetical protein